MIGLQLSACQKTYNEEFPVETFSTFEGFESLDSILWFHPFEAFLKLLRLLISAWIAINHPDKVREQHSLHYFCVYFLVINT